MYGGMGSAVTPDLSKGGEIDGDLTITGDFKVEGAGSFAFDEIIQGSMQVTGSNTFIDVLDTDSSLKITMRGGNSVGAIGTYSNHPLSIRTNTTERIHITSAGLVGIGTNNPQKLFHLSQTGTGDIARIESTGESFSIQMMADDSGTPVNYQMTHTGSKFVHYNNGNIVHASLKTGEVGIGTDSPTKGKLEVYGNGADTTLAIHEDGGSHKAQLHLRSGGNDVKLYTNASDNKFHIDTESVTKAFTILSDGSTGIGTDSPSTKLHISNSVDSWDGYLRITNTNDGGSDGSIIMDNAGMKLRTMDSGDHFHFRNSANTTNFIIQDDGKTGIGTSSPYYKADIRFANTNTSFSGGSNGAWGGNGLRIENTSSTANTMSAIHLRNYDADIHIASIYNSSNNSDLGIFIEGSEKVRIKSGGNVGIGTGSPRDVGGNTTLDVKNIYIGQNGALHGSINSDDGVYINFDANNSVTNASFNVGTNGSGTGGTILFKIDDSSRISLSNNDNGTSNTIFGKNAGNLVSSGGNHNVFIGELSASQSAMTGIQNVGIGYESLKILETGSNLIAIGYQAGKSTTTNGHSVIIGQGAGRDGNVASYSVLIGNFAGYKSTGDITAVGSSAGSNLTTGTRNTYFGSSSGFGNHTGSFNTYVGWRSGYGVADNANDFNTALGYTSLTAVTTGSSNVALGAVALAEHTTGSNNVAIGFGSMYRTGGSNASTSTDNIAIGTYALGGDWADVASNENVAIGRSSLQANLNGSNYNVAVGHKALFSQTQPDGNVAVGYQSGYYNVTGSTNTWLGYVAGKGASGESNSGNTGLGYASLMDITTGTNNVAVGRESLVNLTTGSQNVALGMSSLLDNTTGSDNVSIGAYSSAENITGGSNIAIGTNALNYNESGANNVAVGRMSMQGASGQSHSSNTAVGYQSLYSVSTGGTNSTLGTYSMMENTTGSNNVAMGYYTSRYNETGQKNTAIGSQAMAGADGQNHSENTAVGFQALTAITTGGSNVAVGSNALDSLTTGAGNVAIGVEALATEDTATGSIGIGFKALTVQNGNGKNVSIGYQSTSRNTTGEKNVMIGFEAGLGTVSGNWTKNVGVGHQALYKLQSGERNVGLGDSAGFNITTGSNNVVLGAESGDSITTDSNVVAIGYSAYSAQDTSNDAEGSSGHGSGNIAIGYQSMTSFNHVDFLRNTAVGFQTMSAGGDADAQDNVAVGYRALQLIEGGDHNTAIGAYAGDAITSGYRNTLLGYKAGTSINSGYNNVLIGFEGAEGVTSGYDNVIIGANPSQANLTQSTLIGFNAGKEGTAHNTVGVGYRALGLGTLTTVANGAVAIGHSALASLTSGASNTAIGYEAGKAMTTNTNNTIMGYGAFKLADGNEDKNVVIGAGAGDQINNDQCDNNVIIGKEAYRGGTGVLTGSVIIGAEASKTPHVRNVLDSIFIGHKVAFQEFGGQCNYNVGIGAEAMSAGNLNDAHGNVALGYKAMEALTQSDNNVAIGKEALKSITHGAGGNIAIGASALEDLDTGTYNFGGGLEAIKNVTTGTRNVGIGTESGTTLTTGSYNTIIGSSANVGANDHVYTTSIGYQAKSENSFETSLGFGGAFKFASFTYEADHASADDGDIASSHGINLKIPAYAVIKSVSAIVTRLSNLGTLNLAVIYSDDANSPNDDAGMTNAVELIGAGASTSKSGGSGNASDIECGSGAVLKKAFYNGFDGNGLHVGAGDRYIHLVQAGTGNGDTDPSTSAQVKILVEYVGMD